MKKRAAEAAAAHEAAWDGGRGSHHPDFDPEAAADGALRADRATELMYNAIVADDIDGVYKALEDGADPGWEFGLAYKSREGYTPLMAAAHRGHLAAATALLRAGADPNHVNAGGDAALFWAIDGGVGMTQLFIRYGASLDASCPRGWTPLSYAVAKVKYGATEEKGVYPEVRGREGREGRQLLCVERARRPPLFFLADTHPPPQTSHTRTCSNTMAPPSTVPAPPPWGAARRASRSTRRVPRSCASVARTRTRWPTREEEACGEERTVAGKDIHFFLQTTRNRDHPHKPPSHQITPLALPPQPRAPAAPAPPPPARPPPAAGRRATQRRASWLRRLRVQRARARRARPTG